MSPHRSAAPRAAIVITCALLLTSVARLSGAQGAAPVNVVNQPTVVIADDRQPIHFEYQASGGSLFNQLTTGLYQVPAGMRLTLTFVSGVAGSPVNVYVTNISLSAVGAGGGTRARHFLAIPPAALLNSSDFNVVSFSHPFNLVVNAGEKVGLNFSRSSGFVGTPAATVTISMSGYLEAVP